jgi:fumarate hydratase subunit alpha
MNLNDKISKAIIEASTTYPKSRIDAFKKALKNETNENAAWALKIMIKNAEIAKNKKLPLCDDTGIPHIFIEQGKNSIINNEILNEINLGIEKGLNRLPARPMAVKGDDIQRIEQSIGLNSSPSMVKPAPILLDASNDENTKIHILLLGGGPEIRAKTYRIFHKHSHDEVLNEIIIWLKNSLPMLGCTPSIPCIGIGRTHYEATSLMIKSMIYGDLENQTQMEQKITNEINKTKIGPMGLGGDTTVLGSFIKIGNQRASGVRIVSLRPSCFVEPRIATITL